MVWWEVLTQTSAYPQFVATLGMLALTAFLIYVDFNNVAHRAFALLLALRALLMVSATLTGLYTYLPPPTHGGIGDSQAAVVWGSVAPYFALAMPFVIVRFATVYPRRRTWFGRTKAGELTLLAAAISIQILYLVDHSLYLTPHTLSLGSPPGPTWTTTELRTDGPLAGALALMTLGFSLLGLLFTIDFLRLPAGPRRNGIFVVASAFMLNALFDGTFALSALVGGPPNANGRWIVQLTALAVLAPLMSIALLVRRAFDRTDATARTHITRLLLVAPLPIASGIIAIALAQFPTIWLILTGFWRLWLPALVTYALVRHQLFDIDLKIKFAVKQSTMAGLAFVGFVVLSETLEAIITSSSVLTETVPERWTDLASLGVAVGLTYALNPVKALAGNVANRVMPGTTGTEEYLARKRIEVFRATLEGAVEDGAMTDKERILVEKLRTQLGLSEAEVQPILADVEAAYEGRTIGRPPPAATP